MNNAIHGRSSLPPTLGKIAMENKTEQLLSTGFVQSVFVIR